MDVDIFKSIQTEQDLDEKWICAKILNEEICNKSKCTLT